MTARGARGKSRTRRRSRKTEDKETQPEGGKTTSAGNEYKPDNSNTTPAGKENNGTKPENGSKSSGSVIKMGASFFALLIAFAGGKLVIIRVVHE